MPTDGKPAQARAIMMMVFKPWIWRFAWRDSRSSRRRLLLYVSSISLGVAALVAISSFGANLERAVDDQARTLLGADLAVRSNRAFDEEAEALFRSIPGESSRQISTSTMAFFPKNSATRLVVARGLSGGFPYFGDLETVPPEAARSFRSGRSALVDDGLMVQFGIELGDEIRIGNQTLEIVGRLVDIPGEAPAVAMVGPRVYIPYDLLTESGLIQYGSRVSYRALFKLPEDLDAEELSRDLRPQLRQLQLRSETVDDRKASLGRAMENLYQFLNLVGFVALLLGGIGVASSIHLYLKQKISTVAVLRCLGAKPRQAFAIYLCQAAALGAVGAAIGGVLGLGVQFLLPEVLRDFLPVQLDFRLSWSALASGVFLGLGITLLFALLPLLPVRLITPLLTLRSEFEASQTAFKDRARWIVLLGISAAIFVFARSQTDSWLQALGFCAGLAGVFLLLAGTSRLVMYSARRFFPSSWSYVWRQGLANLFRPQNQTLVLMLSLGLGTFLIMTLFLVQSGLLANVALTGGQDRPNLAFMDIQTDQVDEILQMAQEMNLPVLQRTPMVTMRLSKVKGREVREIIEDPRRRGPRWPYTREYRPTYRPQLSDAETLLEGSFTGSADPEKEDVPVSVEEGVVRLLDLKIGDELVWDVQGVPIRTVVGSVRRVDFQRFQPAFLVVFPEGVLEQAPQFYVLLARTETSEQSGMAQRAVVARFPNVSAIDLTLIINTLDDILSKISFVIRFMALFSVVTGLIVLAGAVVTGRFQRIRESVLLRTLGASRKQVLRILLIEYFFLGSLAASAGLALSLAGGWALSRFVFEVDYAPDAAPFAVAFLIAGGLTVIIGMLNSRGILDRPPLEVLRAES